MSSSNNLIVNKSKPFLGKIIIPGDKSISHRSIIIGSLAEGKLSITNFLRSDDCLHTISAMRSLGAKITDLKEQIIIEGIGLNNLTKPKNIIYAGNSGNNLSSFDSTNKSPRPLIMKAFDMGGKVETNSNTSAPPNPN